MSETATAIPNFTVCEATGKYKARRQLTGKQIINAAQKLLAKQGQKGAPFTGVNQVTKYLIINYAEHKNEVFICMFLDKKRRLIKKEELFHGTIDAAAVYPRVVVQRCLELNASAVVFAHNHPSGDPTPSEADFTITAELEKLLAVIGVEVLDHFVIGSEGVMSIAALKMLEGLGDE